MAGSGDQFQTISATCGVPGVREILGAEDATGMSFGLVVSRFHTDLTSALAGSVVESLVAMGAEPGDIGVLWVPGAFEIPTLLERWAESASMSAWFALGCVVEGATSHADCIVREVTGSLANIARTRQVPVIDGVVAAPSLALAAERCLPGPACRAPYLARAAVEAATVIRRLDAGAWRHG